MLIPSYTSLSLDSCSWRGIVFLAEATQDV